MEDKIKQIQRDIALIDELLSSNTENGIVEFKHNNESPEMIGKLCSALSNKARINQDDFAYVIWGIEDGTQNIVGTTFNPETKTKGNQVFIMWLSQMLMLRITFNFRKVNHSKGNLVLLEIPATHTTPVEFDKTAYIRIGSATPQLSDYPEYYQNLINNLRSYMWEKAIAKSFVTADDVLKLLEYTAYFKLTKQNLPDNKKGILERLEADDLIKKDVGGHWNITNLGAILFAPRSFANMSVSERTRACYQHSIMKYLDGEKMKNTSLCERFGIDKKNAAQASIVIKKALEIKVIKVADPEHPRGGYEPIWA